MKKKVLLLTSLVLVYFAYSYAQNLWRGETLTHIQAAKKWGQVEYTPEKFKSSGMSDRAKMASKILLDKSLIGLSVEKIREKFGSPDGFYFIDTYPAYLIQEGKNNREETWQVVFLLNAKYEVREIIIHKNCCDKQ